MAVGRLILGNTVFSDGYDINNDPAKDGGDYAMHDIPSRKPTLHQTAGRSAVVKRTIGEKSQERWEEVTGL